MNTYQANLLKRSHFKFYSELGEEKIEFNEELNLYQNEDYRVTNYRIVISNQTINHVVYMRKKYTCNDEGIIEIPFDINKNDSSMKISFKNNLADDCELCINLILSNHEQFDSKIAIRNQEELNNNIKLILREGDSLLNILYKKSNNNVVKTVLHVFTIENGTEYTIFEGEDNNGFKSITGLAPGTYTCKISQYDSKESLIASSAKTISLSSYNYKEELKFIVNEIKRIKNNTGISQVVI